MWSCEKAQKKEERTYGDASNVFDDDDGAFKFTLCTVGGISVFNVLKT